MNAYYRAAERAGRRRSSTTPRSTSVDIRDGCLPFRHRDQRAARRYARAPAAPSCSPAGGFESNLEWLRGGLGAAGRQFPHPRHALQHGPLPAPADGQGRQDRSAIRRSATWWRSTRARRSSTAASSPASTACRSASSSTATPSASTTRARTSGPSATRSGAGSSPQQPDQIAYSIIDAKAIGKFMPPVFPPIGAKPLGELARASSSLDAATLAKTVAEFNAAVRPGTFDHAVLDDCRTEGLDAAQDPLGARHRHAAVLRLSRCARASPSPISASP